MKQIIVVKCADCPYCSNHYNECQHEGAYDRVNKKHREFKGQDYQVEIPAWCPIGDLK